MALNSKFHTDLSKVEPIVFGGFTKSQIITGLSMLPAVALIIVEVFVIKGMFFWIVALLTAGIFVIPAYLKGSGKFEQTKASWFYDMKIQDRDYQVGQIRKYTPDEFIQKKEVKETDRFTD